MVRRSDLAFLRDRIGLVATTGTVLNSLAFRATRLFLPRD